jgi:hypothetical protein
MYKKSKDIKNQLKHLNDCYLVFKNYADNQNIAEENKKDFISLLLKNYIRSSELISEDDIQEVLNIKEIND